MRLLLLAALFAAPAAHAQTVLTEFEGRTAYRLFDPVSAGAGIRAAAGGTVAEFGVPLTGRQFLLADFRYRSGRHGPMTAVTADGDTVRSREFSGHLQVALAVERAGSVRLTTPLLTDSLASLEIASFTGGLIDTLTLGPTVPADGWHRRGAGAALAIEVTAGQPVAFVAEPDLGQVAVHLYTGDGFVRGERAVISDDGTAALGTFVPEASGAVLVLFTQNGNTAPGPVSVAVLGASAWTGVTAEALADLIEQRTAARSAACPALTADLRAGTVNGLSDPTDDALRSLICPADAHRDLDDALGRRGLNRLGDIHAWSIQDEFEGTVVPDVLGLPLAEARRGLGLPGSGDDGISDDSMPYGCLYLMEFEDPDRGVTNASISREPCDD